VPLSTPKDALKEEIAEKWFCGAPGDPALADGPHLGERGRGTGGNRRRYGQV